MGFKSVSAQEPANNAITKLNDNARLAFDKCDRGIYNKYEIDHLYDVVGTVKRYTRELELGHLTSTYTNWSHLDTQDGMSIWKYPISNYTDSDYNELYVNDVKMVYKGSATSESTPTSFDYVYVSNSKRSGATYTDNTTEAGSASGTPFNIISNVNNNETLSASYTTVNLAYINILEGTLTVSTVDYSSTYVENTDYELDYEYGTITVLSTGTITVGSSILINYKAGSIVYFGYNSGTFENITTELGTRGVGNRIEFQYSSGSSWASFVPTDSTSKFSVDGNISWQSSGLTGWTISTVNSASAYWIRVRSLSQGLIPPTIYNITIADSIITKLLKMSETDFDNNNYNWGYFSGYVYIAIPNNGLLSNEGVTFIKSGSTDTQKRNYFIYNNTYLINYVNNLTIESTTRMLQVDNIYISSNSPASLTELNGREAVTTFQYTSQPYALFTIPLSRLDITQDLQVHLDYAISSSSASKYIKLMLDYDVIDNGDDVTPSSRTATVSSTIALASTSDINTFLTVSGLSISTSNLTSNAGSVVCKLWRASGIANHHTGDMYIRNIYISNLRGVPISSGTIGASGAVLSVFSRTGTVIAVSGDYDASLITNDSGVSGLTVKDALDTLNGNIGGITYSLSNQSSAFIIGSASHYNITGTVSAVLPNASGYNTVMKYIKNVSSGIVTIYPVGGQLIEFNTSYELTYQGETISIMSDNTNWFIY